MPDRSVTDRDAPASPLSTPQGGETQDRPLDYIWHGQRITYYLNHAGEWHGCPATEKYHYTLRAGAEQ